MLSQISTASVAAAMKGARGYASSPKASMAILDDYLSVSRSHFDQASRSGLDIQIFKSHIPQRTNAERAAFIEKLKPFSVISTMRERTQFPANILKDLPNLKLLLCSELKEAE